MSSDNQYTALGASGNPTVAGFFTHATNITYGVNVQGVDTTGQGCGVYGEAMRHSPGLRRAQDGSRPGIWGVGDHYGVYGASSTLYDNNSDNTPRLSPGVHTGTDGTGAIGVVGASRKVPGVIGTSDVTDETVSASDLFIYDLIPHSAGVMGLSNTSVGVVGANVNVPSNTNLPPQIKTLLESGSPLSNIGVFGWSLSGRGGVFGSAVPIVDGLPIPQAGQGAAPVRILPLHVSTADVGRDDYQKYPNPTPSLPRLGEAGDLIVVRVGIPPRPTALSTAQLWFCIQSGSDTQSALWAEVAFNGVIQGQQH